MLDFLIKNKEWLFSGAGLVVLAALIKWGKKFLPNKARPSVPELAPQGKSSAPSKSTLQHHRLRARIRLGEYFQYPGFDESTKKKRRVVFKGVEIVDDPAQFGLYRDPAHVVRLVVEVGGSIATGTDTVKEVRVNEFLVPVDGKQEPAGVVLSFFVNESFFTFFRCSVCHFNPHTQEIEVDIFTGMASLR